MTDPEPLGRRHPDDVPTPDEIASLLQVEHLLDQRWPETKLEPSTARISALMEMLGSPQRSYPSIHIAGTNGKTSVARMVDALFTAFSRRTGRTTSPHLQAAVERISIDGTPIVQGCMDRKLLINCTHNTVLRLLPAMNLTEQQLHDGCDILAKVLQEQAP